MLFNSILVARSAIHLQEVFTVIIKKPSRIYLGTALQSSLNFIRESFDVAMSFANRKYFVNAFQRLLTLTQERLFALMPL